MLFGVIFVLNYLMNTLLQNESVIVEVSVAAGIFELVKVSLEF